MNKMLFLCKVEIILRGSHIILHYQHHLREKISGDGQEGLTAVPAKLACLLMVVSPPLEMKPWLKVNRNFLIVQISGFDTVAPEQNYSLSNDSLFKI